MATPLRIRRMGRGREGRQDGKNKEVNNEVNLNFCSVRKLCINSAATEKKKRSSWWSWVAQLWAMHLCYHMVLWFQTFGVPPRWGKPPWGRCSLARSPAVEPWGGQRDSPTSSTVPQLWSWRPTCPATLRRRSATVFWGLCWEIHQTALPGGSVTCWTQRERSQWATSAFMLASSPASPAPGYDLGAFCPKRRYSPPSQSTWAL